MFGIGLPELIIIMVIALVIIGPSKLPDMAKALAKGMAEFKKATQEIKEGLDLDGEFQDVKNDLVDSVSGFENVMEGDQAGDQEGNKEDNQTDTPEEEEPKYKDFDEMLGSYEEQKDETTLKSAVTEEDLPEEKKENGE